MPPSYILCPLLHCSSTPAPHDHMPPHFPPTMLLLCCIEGHCIVPACHVRFLGPPPKSLSHGRPQSHRLHNPTPEAGAEAGSGSRRREADTIESSGSSSQSSGGKQHLDWEPSGHRLTPWGWGRVHVACGMSNGQCWSKENSKLLIENVKAQNLSRQVVQVMKDILLSLVNLQAKNFRSHSVLLSWSTNQILL